MSKLDFIIFTILLISPPLLMALSTLPQVDAREAFMIGILYSSILFGLIIGFWNMMTRCIKELEDKIGREE